MRWPLLALFAALPLQWFVVPLPGRLRLHLLALLLFTMLTFTRLGASAVRPVTRSSGVLGAAFLCLLGFVLATDLYHGHGPRDSVELALLMGAALAVATAVRWAFTQDARALELVRWCGPVCVVTLAIALAISLRINGVDPLAVVGQAIGRADPLILQRELYAPAFDGFGLTDESVKSQLRHEVFAALLVAIYLSSAATALRPFRSWAPALVAMVCTGVGLVLLSASLSRAVTIAALAWPLLALWRRVASADLTRRLLAVGLAVLVGAALLAGTGLLAVVWARFSQDTSSYEGRDLLLHQAFANIGKHWLTGGVDTIGESSHNFVLDYWLRNGIFAAAAAAFILAGLVAVLVTMLVRLPGEPPWVVAALAALCLVLVRMFTAGGGAIPPVEWVALGVAAGLMATRPSARISVPRRLEAAAR